MKTLMEKNIKVQEYKNGGGKVTVTTTTESALVKQEIRTKDSGKFEQIKNTPLNLISNNTKYIGQ